MYLFLAEQWGKWSGTRKNTVFNMDLKLNQVDIAQSFTQLDMLKKKLHNCRNINGRLNSTSNE
jgi:hypothetical protein